MSELTPPQKEHIKVLESVQKEMRDTEYVLKGGTGLLMSRSLDRFSEDLDYDTTRKRDLQKRIERGFSNAKVELLSINKYKETDVTQRYKMHYLASNGSRGFLKMETKIVPSIDPDKVETVNGVKVYKVEEQLRQKLKAASDRGNRAPRDLYDIGFLAKKHPEAVEANKEGFFNFGKDIDALDKHYSGRWKQDEVVSKYDITTTLVQIDDRVKEVQANQQKISAASELSEVKNKLHSNEISRREAADMMFKIAGVDKSKVSRSQVMRLKTQADAYLGNDEVKAEAFIQSAKKTIKAAEKKSEKVKNAQKTANKQHI